MGGMMMGQGGKIVAKIMGQGGQRRHDGRLDDGARRQNRSKYS